MGGDRGVDRRCARRGVAGALVQSAGATAAFAFGGAAGAVAVLIAVLGSRRLAGASLAPSRSLAAAEPHAA